MHLALALAALVATAAAPDHAQTHDTHAALHLTAPASDAIAAVPQEALADGELALLTCLDEIGRDGLPKQLINHCRKGRCRVLCVDTTEWIEKHSVRCAEDDCLSCPM